MAVPSGGYRLAFDDDTAWLEQLRSAVDRRLLELLPSGAAGPPRLLEAARYALLSPGKRFRPLITLLAVREFGGDSTLALDAACAFEMVHAASLILDDLPSMDDAQTRRGRPTTHRQFDEATAILAAVGLLNRAFGVIAEDDRLSSTLKAELTRRLSDAVGFAGLVSGQALDLGAREQARTQAEMELLNHRKTGVLIAGAAEAGALIAQASPEAVEAMGRFAVHLGMAFQIHDDLLDVEGGLDLGKDLGQDEGMTTMVSALGVGGAEAAMEAHLAAAETVLADVGARGLLARYALGFFEARKAAA